MYWIKLQGDGPIYSTKQLSFVTSEGAHLPSDWPKHDQLEADLHARYLARVSWPRADISRSGKIAEEAKIRATFEAIIANRADGMTFTQRTRGPLGYSKSRRRHGSRDSHRRDCGRSRGHAPATAGEYSIESVERDHLRTTDQLGLCAGRRGNPLSRRSGGADGSLPYPNSAL
jgi:hypothetical protein